MTRRRPPGTEEGWYALHDLRRIDWEGWRGAPTRARERALEEGIDYLRAHEALDDAEEGGSAVFSVVGHKADLLILHLRPTLEHLDRAERRFESTALADYTERATSYVSVTEVSGYMHEDLTDGLEDVEDEGMRNYMRQRIYPEIPDAEHVCFYPMDKRRGPEDNWYDLSFEERKEYMSAHGEIGREYAGRVSQIITGSVGLDDHEWGVTLFADDPTDIKHLLYEMRFDPSSSRFAEFGSFYVGRRFPPGDLGALLAGEAVPTEESSAGDAAGEASASHVDGGRPSRDTGHEEVDGEAFRHRIHRFGVRPEEYPEAGYGLCFRSETAAEELVEEVDGLRSNFEHYDTHVLTTVRADAGDTAVVSLWANERAANTASGFLADLSGAGPGFGADLGAPEETEAVDAEPHDTTGDGGIRDELEAAGVYAGQPHGEDVHAVVLYSEAEGDELSAELAGFRERFEEYDSHVTSAVYADEHGGRSAVVSIWETRDAAETAGEHLAGLPGIVERAAGAESGFGTMGMFYTVEAGHREEFVETFEEVGEILEGMDGHLDTRLMVNVADENDMFIASQWRKKEDAMAFFRSEAFRDTVQWGREVLADRPRHVFLA
jgi:chlorite dismutase